MPDRVRRVARRAAVVQCLLHHLVPAGAASRLEGQAGEACPAKLATGGRGQHQTNHEDLE
jgi:hypothetical protein